jgi:hypothetical protein
MNVRGWVEGADVSKAPTTTRTHCSRSKWSGLLTFVLRSRSASGRQYHRGQREKIAIVFDGDIETIKRTPTQRLTAMAANAAADSLYVKIDTQLKLQDGVDANQRNFAFRIRIISSR